MPSLVATWTRAKGMWPEGVVLVKWLTAQAIFSNEMRKYFKTAMQILNLTKNKMKQFSQIWTKPEKL